MVDNSERIDKFLKKQMTPEENKKFLEDLKLDKVLRKEAQMTVLMIQELPRETSKRRCRNNRRHTCVKEKRG